MKTGFRFRLLLAAATLLPMGPALADPPEGVTNPLGMQLVRIPAGTFQMGTAEAERQAAVSEMADPDPSAFRDEQPPHPVEIHDPFLIGRTEVTQARWLEVMGNRPGPEDYWAREDWRELPVVGVSWFMAQRFVEELSKRDPDHDYRLPTEAEWEYAARAGSSGLRPMPADQIAEYAWYIANSNDRPQPVAGRRPNAFGLYDTLGNAWEWTADWYAPDTYGEGERRIDPAGPDDGRARVRRGGSYHCPQHLVRPGYRAANPPSVRYSVIGLRVVAEPEASR